MTSQGWRTLSTEPCFWVNTSSDGRVYALAVAYVDDFLIAVDEESADGLSALAGDTFAQRGLLMCTIFIKVAGEVSHCRAPSMLIITTPGFAISCKRTT